MLLPGTPAAPALRAVSSDDIEVTAPALPSDTEHLYVYHRYGEDAFIPFEVVPGAKYPMPAPSTVLGNQTGSFYSVATNSDGSAASGTVSATTLGLSAPPLILTVDTADGSAVTVSVSPPPWPLGFSGQFTLVWKDLDAIGGASASGTLGSSAVLVQVISLIPNHRYQFIVQTYDEYNISVGSQSIIYQALPHEGSPPFPSC